MSTTWPGGLGQVQGPKPGFYDIGNVAPPPKPCRRHVDDMARGSGPGTGPQTRVLRHWQCRPPPQTMSTTCRRHGQGVWARYRAPNQGFTTLAMSPPPPNHVDDMSTTWPGRLGQVQGPKPGFYDIGNVAPPPKPCRRHVDDMARASGPGTGPQTRVLRHW